MEVNHKLNEVTGYFILMFTAYSQCNESILFGKSAPFHEQFFQNELLL